MGSLFEVKTDTRGLSRWESYVSATAVKCAQMAGRDALRAMKAEGSRNIRERKAMKVSQIGKALKLMTDKEALVWTITASSLAMPVAAFPHGQTGKGVSVLINQGKRSVIAHAFKARMRSGHKGVFMRYGQASMVPIQRYKGNKRYAGQKRQPIREVFTTRVSDAFRDAIPDIANRGVSVFGATFNRVLPLEMAKRRT
jgi:hypothetical protein